MENKEKTEFKMSFFQKMALSKVVDLLEKDGIKTVVLKPDKTSEIGLKMDFYKVEINIDKLQKEVETLKSLVEINVDKLQKEVETLKSLNAEKNVAYLNLYKDYVLTGRENENLKNELKKTNL
jgi:ABC-type hemin transport system substrate-binding protein